MRSGEDAAEDLLALQVLALLAPAGEEDEVAVRVEDKSPGVLKDDALVRKVHDLLVAGDRHGPGDQVDRNLAVPVKKSTKLSWKLPQSTPPGSASSMGSRVGGVARAAVAPAVADKSRLI